MNAACKCDASEVGGRSEGGESEGTMFLYSREFTSLALSGGGRCRVRVRVRVRE